MDETFKTTISDKFNYLYVPESSEKLQLIYRKRYEEKKIKTEYFKKYSEILSAYKEIITKAAKLIKEISFNNPTSEFITFLYLLWNGVFSKNMQYVYQTDGLLNIKHLYMLDIIDGHGDCKANSELLKEIFKSLGYNAYFLVNTIQLHYVDYKIDNNIYSENNCLTGSKCYEEDESISPTGDHAAVLLEKNGNYYIYDPTNMLIFKLDTMFTADLYNGIGKCYIKPWGLMIFEFLDQNQILTLLDNIKKQDKSRFLTSEEIKETTIETINNCHNAKKLILEYKDDLKPHIDSIANRQR